MKPWSLVCFLVLAASSASRGDTNITLSPPQDEHRDVNSTDVSDDSTTPRINEDPDEGHNGSVTPSTSSYPTTPSRNTTDEEETPDAEEKNETTVNTPERGEEGVTVSTASTVSLTTAAGGSSRGEESSQSGAYVVLVLIVLVIVVLCTILYLLRRASRTYSFDLQRPPVNHHNQPTGTFEAVYLDERADLKDLVSDDLSPPPVANGTSQQLEENDAEETESPQQPDLNGVETPPITATASGDGPADQTSDPPSNSDLLFDAVSEQQNENNNNPSVCSSDPFVEINLDEPVWCDQLLTAPVAPSSSVLPFSPFSFSSSSSSSS